MFYLRQADKRGRTQTDWLDSRHTFSFGKYYDPRFMAFSDLRVINDDVVAPSGGFGTHPHDNMEIVSVVFAGRLEHKDSLGSGSVITPGEVQAMTAGTGIHHSEFNPSAEESVHFLQIWIMPDMQAAEVRAGKDERPLVPDRIAGRRGGVVENLSGRKNLSDPFVGRRRTGIFGRRKTGGLDSGCFRIGRRQRQSAGRRRRAGGL